MSNSQRRTRGQLRTIDWVRHEVRVPPRSPLHDMTISPAGTGVETVADDTSALAHIELPNLVAYPTAVEKVRFLLHAAAEIEHALLIQYLYAAYSLKRPADVNDPQQKTALSTWSRALAGIAKEEMGHLMTVQNLLLFTRQPLNFEREDFPAPAHVYPFKMRLQPLTKASLATYVVAESPVDAPGMADIVKLAVEEAGATPNRVGILYALLGVVFTKLGDLEQNASTGDRWYETVRDVAYLAYLQEPGAHRWHLPDVAFDPGSLSAQARDIDWAQAQDIRVFPVADRSAALSALRDIGIQGEGPVQSSNDPPSHFARFLRTFRGEGAVMAFPDPLPEGVWEPARKVPVDPKLDGSPGAPNLIDRPKAREFAQLADLRYALLLGFIEQYFLVSPAKRQFLRDWSFDEMRSLRTLTGILTSLPRSTAPGAEGVAALPFNLPDELHLPAGPADQWQLHIDRFKQSIALVERMLEHHAGGADGLSPTEQGTLEVMKQRDAEKLEIARRAQQGEFPSGGIT